LLAAMRLLFVNYEFPPVGGGAAYASLATARELVALGHRVDFLTTATAGSSTDDQLDGIRVHRVPSFRRGVHHSGFGGALSFVGFAARRIGELARAHRYDVYHYYFSLPTALLSCVPGPHRARPYVVSLRGSDVPGYDSALNLGHQLLLPLTRHIWRGAYRVVANSADLRRLALAAAPGTPIDVILNGSTACATMTRARDGSTGLRVLAVSRLIPRKGLDTLILALCKTGREQLSLDIAGAGPDAGPLQRLARSCGVADRVRFHGFVDRAGLSALFANADMFVLASRAESCSMALLEAMAAGLPLVATDVGGNGEIVQHGRNGLLFKVQDVDALASALQTLAADAPLRQRFAAANRALARERFSWQAVARGYEALFSEATARYATPQHGLAAQAERPAGPSDRTQQ
jgi:glycogen synthase